MERKLLINEILHCACKFMPRFKKQYISKPASFFDVKLTSHEFICINILNEYKSLTMSEIAEHLNISLQQVTRIIDSLVLKNMVHRFTPLDNRRQVKVELSEYGKNQFEVFKQRAYLQSYNHLNTLTDDELLHCVEYIKGLDEIFNKSK